MSRPCFRQAREVQYAALQRLMDKNVLLGYKVRRVCFVCLTEIDR